MHAPTDPLDNDRLDALVDGHAGATPRERKLVGVVRELRAAKPAAPPELRERVGLLREPVLAPRPFLDRLRPRRAALVLVPACLAAVLAAVALNRSSATTGDEQAAATVVTADAETAGEAARSAPADTDRSFGGADAAQDRRALSPALGQATQNAAPAPARGRAQDYRAELAVLVDDVDELSRATQQAMRITRSLGGFVVSAHYGKPVGEDGDSMLTVRIPVTRVQEAIGRFGDLGTIIAQNISIRDLQGQVNRQTESIADLRKTIGRIERLLDDQSLSAETRARLELRLDDAKRSLAQARAAREQTLRTARLSHVSLTLTTRDEGVVVPPAPPSEFEQTLRDAVSILGVVVAWTMATLIVLSPFIAIVLAAWLLSRAGRRRANQALLERS